MAGSVVHDELRALLGDKALVRPEDQGRYETGYRYGSGKAAAVVRPEDTDGVRSLLGFCRKEHMRLVIQGAHTGLVGAATPDESGNVVVLSLERMRAVSVDPFNRTATCGAGALLSSLNAAAAVHGLHLPIDLGAHPSLGGLVATNAGGARLLRYGGMREQLVGLEAVFADERLTVLRGSKGLRKDNVGLDLKQLFVGSGGKIVVITEVQVELQPIVTQSAMALAIPVDIERIPEIVVRLESHLDQFLLACEGMSKFAMLAALDSHPALRRPFHDTPDFALLIEVGSSASIKTDFNVETLLEDALATCIEGNAPLLQDAIVGRGRDFWALRHAISEGLKTRGRVIGFDVSVRRDLIPQTRSALIAEVERQFPNLRICDFGHVADGGMHFNIVVPKPQTLDPDSVMRLRSLVFGIVVRDFGGSFSAEHGIGSANLAEYNEYRDRGERSIIELISAITDPQRLFR